jgi:hypothetical protein
MSKDTLGHFNISFDRLPEQEEFTDPKDILKFLLESKQHGTVIGISAPVFGRIMVMTCVQDLILEHAPVVILSPYDMTGHMLPITKIQLDSIRSVRPFTSKFQNPYASKLSDAQSVN